MSALKKAARQVAALAAVLFVICVVCRLAMGNDYTFYMPLRNGEHPAGAPLYMQQDEPVVRDPGPIHPDGNDRVRVTVHPERRGSAYVNLVDSAGQDVAGTVLRVGAFNTVVDLATGGFTGDRVVLIAVAVFFLATGVIMAAAHRRMYDPDFTTFYSYESIYSAGLSMFTLITGLVMASLAIRHMLRPDEFFMFMIVSAVSSASFQFVMLTGPVVIGFSVALAISNVELLRHERLKGHNLLGIGVALGLIVSVIGLFVFDSLDYAGSEFGLHVRNTVRNVTATVIAYFECMLLSSAICGLRAARHKPSFGADYILILGCVIRRDGTPTPLLRGRVDKAVAYWREQLEQTGKRAILMPSGGQGPGEVIAEAESMRRYLIENGIPSDAIHIEDQSKNTYQNMTCSKALIEQEKQAPRVVYATTGYHVFRSGVWAKLAGLRVEGMGSKTKWWYWPNAFMRECAGLLRNRLRQEIIMLVVLNVIFAALSLIMV